MSLPASNYTQIPNEVLDRLPELKNAEVRVILTVCRQTLGWQRTRRRLSISYLMKQTGLSRKSVIRACKSLLELGWVERYQVKTSSGCSFEYELKIAPESPQAVDLVHPQAVDLVHPYKESILKETIEKKDPPIVPQDQEYFSLNQDESQLKNPNAAVDQARQESVLEAELLEPQDLMPRNSPAAINSATAVEVRDPMGDRLRAGKVGRPWDECGREQRQAFRRFLSNTSLKFIKDKGDRMGTVDQWLVNAAHALPGQRRYEQVSMAWERFMESAAGAESMGELVQDEKALEESRFFERIKVTHRSLFEAMLAQGKVPAHCQ